MSKLLKVMAVFAILAVAIPASADTITVTGTVGGQTVNVLGTIVAGNGTVTITLNNNLMNAQVVSVIQNISGVYFQVSGYNGGAVGMASSMSGGSALFINGSNTATPGAGFNPTGWTVSIVGGTGTQIQVCVICAGGNPPSGPTQTILGGTGSGLYANAVGSITGGNGPNNPHDPFLTGQVVFVVNVPGVTPNSTFSGVVVQFGTTATPPTSVPEPGTLALLGASLLGAVGMKRRTK